MVQQVVRLQAVFLLVIGIKAVVAQEDDAPAKLEQFEVCRQCFVRFLPVISVIAESVQSVGQAAFVHAPGNRFQPDVPHVVYLRAVNGGGYLAHGIQPPGFLVHHIQRIVCYDDLYLLPPYHPLYHVEHARVQRIGRTDTQVGTYLQQPAVVATEQFAVHPLELPHLPLGAFHQPQGGEHLRVAGLFLRRVKHPLVGSHQQIAVPQGGIVHRADVAVHRLVIVHAGRVVYVGYAAVQRRPHVVLPVFVEVEHRVVLQRIACVEMVQHVALRVHFINAVEQGAQVKDVAGRAVDGAVQLLSCQQAGKRRVPAGELPVLVQVKPSVRRAHQATVLAIGQDDTRQAARQEFAARHPGQLPVFQPVKLAVHLLHPALVAHLLHEQEAFRAGEPPHLPPVVDVDVAERLEIHVIAVDVHAPETLVVGTLPGQQLLQRSVAQASRAVAVPTAQLVRATHVDGVVRLYRQGTHNGHARHGVQVPLHAVRHQQSGIVPHVHHPALVLPHSPVFVGSPVLVARIIDDIRTAAVEGRMARLGKSDSHEQQQ